LSAGHTQEELASLSGLGVRTITDLEHGVSLSPRSSTVEALADALHLSGATRASFLAAARRRHGAFPQEQEETPTAGASSFVGRVGELAAGGRFLAGSGRAVLLFSGEPGIGKSRLLRELIVQARGAGWRVVAGGCDQRSGREPYAPFVEMLEETLRATPPSRRKGDLKACDWLARLGPELAERIRTPVPEWSLTPEQERRVVFAAARRYLSNIAGPAGTLLVLDDLQWAGLDALDLLAFLVHPRAIEAPSDSTPAPALRVLGAYRTSEVQSGHPLENVIVDLALDERVRVHELARLSEGEARSLATNLVGSAPHADQWIADALPRADGIPFYLINFAQAFCPGVEAAPLADDGDVSMRDLEIPWLVTATIRRRLASLPPEAQETLALAAIVGRVAPFDLLRLTRRSSGDDLAVSLEAACHARLLEEVGASVAAYRFTHDLIRETILASLSKARQALLHRAVADTLEQLPGLERGRHIAALADHLMKAGEPGRALPYVLLAGDQAEAVYAHAEAAGQYRTALDLARTVDDVRREALALEKLGTALWEGARLDEARAVGDRAAHLYQSLGDRDGELRALAVITWRYAGVGQIDVCESRVLPRLTALEAEATERDAPGIARAYFGLSLVYVMSARRREALAMLERGERFACTAQDDALRLQTLAARAFGMATLGIADPLEEALEIITLAERLGDAQNLWVGLNIAFNSYLNAGDFARARGYLHRMQAQDELHQRPGPSLGNTGELAFHSGDWQRARQAWEAQTAFEERDEPFTSMVPGYGSMSLGVLELAEGHEEAALSRLTPALARAFAVGDVQALLFMVTPLAEARLLASLAEEARSYLVRVFAHPGMQEMSFSSSWLTPVMAWADLVLGQIDQAREEIEACDSYVRTQGRRLLLPNVLYARALIAVASMQWNVAEAALDEALALAHTMPLPMAELKALWVYGRLEAARDDPAAAHTRFEEALAICHRLGEGLYRPHIERALAGLKDEGTQRAERR
jgi:predicted ATPase/transcriptional regulator with XRE-family HTH domain